MKKILYLILAIIFIFLIIVGIRYHNNSSNELENISELESVLDCENNQCKTAYISEYTDDVVYMFLNNYDDYYDYRERYNKTFPEFKGNIKKYNKYFFKKNKLIVFQAINCGITNIDYDGTEAIINYAPTDCAYLYGEINVIKVKQNTESIRFNNI